MPKRKDGEKHRGRKARTMKKIGRPRIIESPAEMDRLVEEYVTRCHEQGGLLGGRVARPLRDKPQRSRIISHQERGVES